MKQRIIKINDISEIDTSKISVYDLNNRYIDKNGSMFSLKYNRGERKVEIIKIVRAYKEEISDLKQKITKKRFAPIESEIIDKETITGETNADKNEEEQEIEDKAEFNPSTFLDDTLSIIKSHKERLKGIIKNIRDSNAIPKDHKADNSELEDIFRNFEIDGDKGFDSIESYKHEITNYPKSATYYQSKISGKGTEVIQILSDNNEKLMKFIYFHEMHSTIKNHYIRLKEMVKKLTGFFDNKEEDEITTTTPYEKQAFEDAMISIDNTAEEIEKILDGMQKLEEYIFDLKNFE